MSQPTARTDPRSGLRSTLILRQLEAEVALLHDARWRDYTRVAGHEDRLRIAVTQRLKLAQPAGKNGSDAVQRQLGVNVQNALRLACDKTFSGAHGESPLQLRKRCRRERKSDRECVAPEACEEIGAGFDRFEQLKAIDGSAGAVRHAVFDADNERGLCRTFHYTRGEDADDAAMPAVAVHNNEVCGCKLVVRGEARFNRGQRAGFGVAAFAIEALELVGEFAGPASVARGEKFDDF